MLTLHLPSFPFWQRILWLLEELQIPLPDCALPARSAKPAGTAELKAIHPFGQIAGDSPMATLPLPNPARFSYLGGACSPSGRGRTGAAGAAGRRAGASPVPFLDALCRRLADELAGDEAGVCHHSASRCRFCRPVPASCEMEQVQAN